MKQKNIYLWNKSIFSGIVLPTLWFSSKAYFEENSTTADEWSWHDPFLHTHSIDHILNLCEKNPPHFFGFSLYIWNHIEADNIAQEIKRRYPDCLIVYGGPQIDIKYSSSFFVDHPWVDLVVPSDVYGEPILHYILDNFNTLKHQDIPEVYFHRSGIKFKSQHDFVKRQFVWPKDMFINNQEYLKFDTTNSLAIYETTRGCPYRCTYCDWGGGTFTKVTKKPLSTVFSEIEELCKNKLENIFVADANFGIFKEDVEIAQHLVNMKEKYGYPNNVFVENAKNNLSRVIEIQRILMAGKLVFMYKIAVQNTNAEIKENIERIDIPFDDYLKETLKLKEEFNAPVMVESILGLPGDSYIRTLESIDLYYRSTIDMFRSSIWNLLPEAPAYDPAYRKKFKIQTKWFEIYSHPFRNKSFNKEDNMAFSISNSDTMYVENVISTYSYSKHEWCDMLAVSMIASSINTIGLHFLIKFLDQQYQIKPSKFYHVLYKEIICKSIFSSQILNEKLGMLPDSLISLVDDPTVRRLEFDIGEDFPFLLAPHVYFTFAVMLYPEDFFKTVADYFADVLHDKKIRELGKFLSNIMIDLTYDPLVGRRFKTEYNWYSHLFKDAPLTNGKYEYIISDKLLKFVKITDFEYSDYPAAIDLAYKTKQFFYHRAANVARQKYAHHIIEEG